MKRRELLWVFLERLSILFAGLLIAWVLLSAEFNPIGALLIVAVGALVALPASVYRHPTMRAIGLACGLCFVIATIVGIGVAVIGYMIESTEVAPSIFPLRIAVPMVSSLFIAAAIILVKQWRGSLLFDVRERQSGAHVTRQHHSDLSRSML